MKKALFLFLVGFVVSGCGLSDNSESDKIERGDAIVNDKEIVEESVAVGEVEVVDPVDVVESQNYVISASSVLEDNTDIGFKYDEAMLLDKDFSTAWCKTVENSNPVVTIQFDDLVKADNVGFILGFGRDESIYMKNDRVKELRISFPNSDSDGIDDVVSKAFTFPDEYGMHFVDLGGVSFKTVTFEILNTYPGSKYNDVCMAEIDFWSDYVVNEDKVAAMNYYKEYKESAALKPNDIVSRILISDNPINECKEPSKAAGYTDYSADAINCCSAYATGIVNEFGKNSDNVDVRWYKGIPDPSKPMYMGGGEVIDWKLAKQEFELPVVEACDGELYVQASLDMVEEYSEFPLGTWMVQFYKNGNMISSQQFNAAQ